MVKTSRRRIGRNKREFVRTDGGKNKGKGVGLTHLGGTLNAIEWDKG